MPSRRTLGHLKQLLCLVTAPLFAAALLSGRASADPTLREFSEKQVAAGDGNQIVVRHLRLAGTNEAIGWKLAEIAHSRHGAEPTADRAERTKLRWQFYKSQYPTHYARAAGAAGLFGAPVDGPADTMSLPLNLDFAPGCSVVYYPPDFTEAGHAMLSRNYDFSTATFAEINGQKPPPGMRSSTADPYVIEMYPDQGYASLYLCAYDLLGGCLDGINSKGLTVALLANEDTGDDAPVAPTGSSRVGLDEVEIPRFVLDRCATVDEAREALANIPIYYSFVPCHYIIGDRSGRSMIWEYSTDLKERHVTAGEGRPQVVTNHAVYKYEARKKPAAGGSGNSFVRYRRLEREIAKLPKGRSVDEMKRTNACVKANGPLRSRGADLPPRVERTLWHGVYDCQDLTLDVDFYLAEDAAGGEKRSGYMQFKLDAAAGARKGQG